MIYTVSLTGHRRPGKFIAEFIGFPKKLYRDVPQWIPWFDMDMKEILGKKHPFFHLAEGEFFLALEDDRTVGRICVVSNTRYQKQNSRKCAHFFFLDAFENLDAFRSLIGAAADWARDRGLDSLEGPMLFGGTYGCGVLVKGFELRAPMTMMPYNFPYYPAMLEALGFAKLFDVIGADISPDKFNLPERISNVAEIVLKRGRFKVLQFKSKKQILRRADKIAEMYNATLGDHPENYPLSDEELERVKKDLLMVASPDLVKILEYDGAIVGFLFAFADASGSLRKNMGKITPLGLLRLLSDLRHSKKVLFNGMGILPQYQRLGGNALLYRELTETVKSRKFESAEIVQIAETTELMLSDIRTLGSEINKIHRVYTKAI
jgi:GNAT superfamily N-acetyltransferase